MTIDISVQTKKDPVFGHNRVGKVDRLKMMVMQANCTAIGKADFCVSVVFAAFAELHLLGCASLQPDSTTFNAVNLDAGGFTKVSLYCQVAF